MALLGRTAPESGVDLITTGLNSLANNSSADIAVDLNTYRSGGSGTGLYKLNVNLALILASFTPTTLSINLYCLPAVDDTPTNYADESDPLLVASFPLTSGASAKYVFFGGFPLWRFNRYVKFRVKNVTGTSLAGSGNILRAWFHTGDESL
jgi:hypothetical protein